MSKASDSRAAYLLGLELGERQQLLARMSKRQHLSLRHHWRLWAHAGQLPMDGLRLLNRATGQQIYYLGSWRIAAKPVPPTGGTTIDPQARTAIAAIISALVDAGIVAA